jgi:hypothetical protein
MYECRQLADAQLVCSSHHIVWLYPLLVAAPGWDTLIGLAGISGILLTALGLLKRASLGVRMLVAFVIILALGCNLLFFIFLASNPGFRHSDSITAHGKYYHLLEVKYHPGPRYEVVLACDAFGVRCEELLVGGGISGKLVDFPAFVSQLAQP